MAEPVSQQAPKVGWMDWLRDLAKRTHEANLQESELTRRAFPQEGKPMRFDAYGRTEPAKEKGGAPLSERDLQQIEDYGGMAGAIGPNPIRGRKTLRALRQFYDPSKFTKEGAEMVAADPYLGHVMNPATPIFHGAKTRPEKIAREGLKAGNEPIPGEAKGVSLTNRPAVAESFASMADPPVPTGVFRVHPALDPEEIIRPYTPEGAQIYKDALRKASGDLDRMQFNLAGWQTGQFGSRIVGWEELLQNMQGSNRSLPKEKFAELVRAHLTAGNKGELGEGIRAYLKEKGFGGVLYHPNRYDEFELRHLDPEKIPLIEYRREPYNLRENPSAQRQYSLFPEPAGETLPRKFISKADERAYSYIPDMGERRGIQQLFDEAIRDRFGYPQVGQPINLAHYQNLPDNLGMNHPYVEHLIEMTYTNTPPNVPVDAWEKLSPAVKNYLVNYHKDYFTIDGFSIGDIYGGNLPSF